ncbi:2-oxoglutarate and iron-dependent oxygenase domain-containing protein 3 [Macrotis lagotis]|uniref:2-oxoglutarate and iron-dependent oxygenase domain-containing protein 3 n=1 Tax=Macrotis lagotis TaxID=92651 RepID=UPI003D69A072
MAPLRRAGPKAARGGSSPGAELARPRRPDSIKKNQVHHESQRKWLKISVVGSSGLLVSLLLWSFLNGDDGVTEVLAHHNEILHNRFIEVTCSEDYDSHKRFEGCTPRKCGRGITDIVITREEAEQLRRIAEKGLSLGGSEGGSCLTSCENFLGVCWQRYILHLILQMQKWRQMGLSDVPSVTELASILDLHSGALSFGKHFVNLYRYFGAKIQDIFSEEDFQLYRIKKNQVHHESQRKWLKISVVGSSGLLVSLLLWSFLNGDDGVTEVLAHHNEILHNRFIEVTCSEDYDSHKRFEGCTPRKCGRGITDIVITREEAEQLRRIAEKGLSLGGSEGGASILDLHSGALSFGKHFVNLYRYFGAKIQDIFSEEDFQLYRDVRQKIQHTIGQAFDINISSMYLTKPTFFSRINSTEAKTTHDEYWHPHIDKITYGSFDYTSLLYLSDYMEDFGGGRFVFMEEGLNKTVEPRAGRVSFFTSGSENLHRVEKVHWGTRYAITISFTCNPDHGIGDPVFL